MTSPRISAFHVTAKPAGPFCNLDCRYCFYLEKERLFEGSGERAMSDEFLETFVRDYIAGQDAPLVTFAWQGGEPTLLGLDFFRRVVHLQRRYANGKRIENSFQTNGILIDNEWARFFAEHEFLVGLSIDGPRELHDRYRVDRGGRPTFDRVLTAVETLRRNGAAFNTLTVVHRENARQPLEVYGFLTEIGSSFLQFIPIVERLVVTDTAAATVGPRLSEPGASGEGRVSTWSVDPGDWGAFLCGVFDRWVRRDVGRVFVQMFDVALENWYHGQASLCLFGETCGSAVALEHNGDLYACDHYVFPAWRLGNIMRSPLADLVGSEQQRAFGAAKRDSLPAYCRACPVRFACHGECPKNRFLTTPDGEPGLNYLCAGYKRFFAHAGPAMRFMADELAHERPPANVMAWMAGRALEARLATAGRNDPCPCGSGKKFKKCCGTSS